MSAHRQSPVGASLLAMAAARYIPDLKAWRMARRSDDGIKIQRVGLTNGIPISTTDQLTIVIHGRRRRQLLSHPVLRVCLPTGQVVCQLLGLFRQASVDARKGILTVSMLAVWKDRLFNRVGQKESVDVPTKPGTITS